MMSMLIITDLILVLLGGWYIAGLLVKKINKLDTYDKAFEEIRSTISRKCSAPDPVIQNLLLSDFELLEFGKMISHYFTNICYVNSGLSNDGLLIANYSITGIKPEFVDNKNILIKAITLDIHKFYIENRCVDIWNIHIQTLVEGQLTFWIACNNSGNKVINDIIANRLPMSSADTNLKEEI